MYILYTKQGLASTHFGKQDTFTFQVQIEFLKFAVSILKLASHQGLEPRPTVLETAILPLY